jgi:hypothetical protein
VLENGRPLSLAKAQVRRETEAKMLKSEMKRMRAIMTTRMLVAGTDLVASQETSMMGRPVGVFVTASISPMQKRTATMYAHCIMLFSVTAVIMLCGTRVRGPLTSSPTGCQSKVFNFLFMGRDLLMCRTPSNEVMGKVTVNMPRLKATPGFVQPLTPVVNVLKTYDESLRCARQTKVMIDMMKNITWQIPPIISSVLSIFLNQKFHTTGMTTKPHMIKVPCQRSGV